MCVYTQDGYTETGLEISEIVLFLVGRIPYCDIFTVCVSVAVSRHTFQNISECLSGTVKKGMLYICRPNEVKRAVHGTAKGAVLIADDGQQQENQ